MKTCPYCHAEIPDDSKFCYHCGREIKTEDLKKQKEKRMKTNPKKIQWGKVGIFLFLFTLVVFDFVLGTMAAPFGWNVKTIYIISLVLYGISMLCGILSLYVDHEDLKRGYQPNGSKSFAYAAIFTSLFVGLSNLTQILLK